MKNLTLVFLTLLSISTSQAKDLDAYVVYDSNGKSSNFEKMMKATEGKKFIFFGEFHNNPISHWLQLEMTKRLFSVHKSRLVLGAEMFEADNQYIIDEYLTGKISSKNFQKEVRLWPNYDTDYKPLIEFAKERGLSFIASNIPRRYASIAYKQGLDSLNSLSAMAKSYIVPLDKFEFDSTINCYSKMITDFGGHGSVEIAFSQAIKDATMSHFILKNVNNKSVFVHYNGAYHSDYYEGIVYYLKKEIKASKIMTVSTVSQSNTDKLEEQHLGKADFIICVPDNMTKTH